MRKFRQVRKGEVICKCRSYRFPHRLMGGSCNGQQWVENYLETDMSGCTDCSHWDSGCQVAVGQEPPHKCPALIELLLYEEVPVPKKFNITRWD
jgi:hypothetical protein